MGGLVQRIAQPVEEGAGVVAKEVIQNWYTISGRSFLKSLGPAGEFLAGHLTEYEAYAAKARSNSKLLVEDMHKQANAATLTQRTQQFKNAMRLKATQSGTAISSQMTEPFVYHPDLGKRNSSLRNQALVELRSSGMTTAEAGAT